MPRKPKSIIRENIKKILSVVEEINGYDLYKIYIEVYPKVTMRSIYYNLTKGQELNEFKIKRVIEEEGDFSWGSTSRKVFYKINTVDVPMILNREKSQIIKAYKKTKSKH